MVYQIYIPHSIGCQCSLRGIPVSIKLHSGLMIYGIMILGLGNEAYHLVTDIGRRESRKH